MPALLQFPGGRILLMPSKPILIAAFALSAWSISAQPTDPSPALEKRVDRLQARLESIESIRAIKRLQYAYGHYTELGLWNDFADLFTDDALTNYSQGARGKAEVRKLFFDQVGQGKLGLADGRIYPHILFQPVITLAPDGRTAKGRWRILAMLGGYGGGATWYSGVYENEYVLQDGAWKISVLRSEPKATAAYTATGWKDSGIHVPLHYTAASVAAAIPVGNPKPLTGTLPERVNQLAQRAALLNDQAAVTNVLDTYGYAIDRKQWNQAADLFAGNGTLERGQQGVYVGKTSIRRSLNQFGSSGLNDHVYLQTLVSVAPDGRTANARGVELIFSSDAGGELSEGTFENTFVKQGSTWKIQSVHFYPRMIVDAATGWAKSAKPAPGPSKQFPPDRPPTSTYEIYPKFSVAPFHFDNPVTGKPPQYPAGVSSTSRPTPAAPPAKGPIRNLESRVAEAGRSLAAAEAYDIAENLINAHGYSLDDSPSATGGSILANQILQPVIDVAPDGRSAKLRARTLNLGGTSGGPGYWMAGTLAGQIVSDQGAWKFQTPSTSTVWSAPYPGSWARIP
jgi:hypothetical protein